MIDARRSLLLMALMVAGCAHSPAQRRVAPAIPRATVVVSGPATAPADLKATLTLDQIDPRPLLHARAASTQESEPPPLDAVRLFAKARAAMLDGNNQEAARLLRQALQIDSGSFLLHQTIGDAYSAAADARALEEWDGAARIEPDHLGLQLALAREYLSRRDLQTAMRHLRLAIQTADYRHDDPAAGEADLLLARALQFQGYDRAALEMYERLLGRLHNPRLAVRSNPQIEFLLAHPNALALDIAALYEKHHEFGRALSLLNLALQSEPDNFELHARLARDTAASGQHEQAERLAAEFIIRSGADELSIALLRDVSGSDDAATQVLQRTRARDPDELSIVYALADLLRTRGQSQNAGRVLDEALVRFPDDLRLLGKRTALLQTEGQSSSAARLLAQAFARRPDHDQQLSPLWNALTRPGPRGRLTLADAQRLDVSVNAQSAKLVLVSRLAQLWHRDAAARQSLRDAVQARPLFAPAWRQQLATVWSEDSLTSGQRADESNRLADQAATAGDQPLAAELRAQAFLNQHQPQKAAEQFAQATKLGDRSPELYLNFAAALHDSGNDQAAQSLLGTLARDHPSCNEAFVQLYVLCDKRGDHPQAGRILSAWLRSDPDNIAARRVAAREEFRQRHFAEAEHILLDLFDKHDSDPDVLDGVRQFYAETVRLGEFQAKLEQHLVAEPWNLALATVLAETYAAQERTSDAARVLADAQAAHPNDPDVLYSIAGLYTRIGRKTDSDGILSQVLKLDPAYAGASNDLGYSWAEQGKNLGRAEELVRQALRTEPGNPSFLDSMGWVLYKRGRLEEARQQLAKAATPPQQADPVVLDHLGDTLYRLGDKEQAARQWRQASQRLAELHDEDGRLELKELRVQLLQKQQQLEAGRPVTVAPIAEPQAARE